MNHTAGTVLRTLRLRTGLSSAEVAQRAKVPEFYLLQVERGQATPTDAWLGHVAEILADALVERN
ncbi:multiprotein-bridging factor 1 family protein [Microbacterium sp. NPDC057407]|uniref:helix-turn-helix domain-containing protein n=1 Tax=Microbacterium sp. NPDC057407 TaxID=3346120 RepID=UPI003670F153